MFYILPGSKQSCQGHTPFFLWSSVILSRLASLYSSINLLSLVFEVELVLVNLAIALEDPKKCNNILRSKMKHFLINVTYSLNLRGKIEDIYNLIIFTYIVCVNHKSGYFTNANVTLRIQW